MRYTVTGKTRLAGITHLQGAKNTAMRLIFLPLLHPGVYTLHNIPRISSTQSLLEIVAILGGKFDWTETNTVQVDSTAIKGPKIIPPEVMFHTSGGIYLNTFLTGRFGYFEFNTEGRSDTGGDPIGRVRADLNSPYFKEQGIAVSQNGNLIRYETENSNGFRCNAEGSLGKAIGAMITALFRSSPSQINNVPFTVEVDETLKALTKMGANVTYDPANTTITVNPTQDLHACDFINITDQHEFVTLTIAALITGSTITISGTDLKAMKLEPFIKFLNDIGVELLVDMSNHTVAIPAIDVKSLNQTDIVAGIYPQFVTEWQVLASPLLAMIPGTSTVIEAFNNNRLWHWQDLAKFGAKFEYFTDANYPQVDGKPRAVSITGGIELTAADVTAQDVRSSATYLLTALAASGLSIIDDPQDHLKRGYEDLIGKLSALGAQIDSLS